MKLIFKGRATPVQLKDRIKKGCRDIEIHTEKEDVLDTEGTMDAVMDSGVDVYVVHAPINTEHTIEGCLNNESRDVLRHSCELGQMCAEKFGHFVDIVIHQELDLFQMEAWGIYNRIKSFTEELLGRYSSIRINFENFTPIIDINENVYLTNTYYDGPYKLAQKLREDINTNRVGVVWDSCHSTTSSAQLISAWDNGLLEKFTPIEQLKLYLPFLHVVHLSNSRNWGMQRDHGALFETAEEITQLQDILYTLIDNGYEGVITMETKDTDLENTITQPILRKQVEYMMQHLQKQ